MSIKEFDEARATRARGIEEMARGTCQTVSAVTHYAALDYEQGVVATARAAESFAVGARLLATPVPELRWWERAYVWVRGKLRGAWS